MYDTRLKMSKARYDQVRDTIKAIVEHFGREQVCSLSILACPKIQDVNAALRWKLFDIAMQQLSYDDTTPHLSGGYGSESFRMCQDSLCNQYTVRGWMTTVSTRRSNASNKSLTSLCSDRSLNAGG